MRHLYYIIFGWDAYAEFRVAFMKAHGSRVVQGWEVSGLLGVYLVKIKA